MHSNRRSGDKEIALSPFPPGSHVGAVRGQLGRRPGSRTTQLYEKSQSLKCLGLCLGLWSEHVKVGSHAVKVNDFPPLWGLV